MKENADYNILYFCILMTLFGKTFSTLTVIVLCVDIFVILHQIIKIKINMWNKKYFNKKYILITKILI